MDSCNPTRIARHGLLLCTTGPVKIKQARYLDDFSPIDPDCETIPYSRSYLCARGLPTTSPGYRQHADDAECTVHRALACKLPHGLTSDSRVYLAFYPSPSIGH
mmetsp:Transcript_6450/g.14063  ORF Transcript_6450/g.14063 Transcript_6450/m.14063 type:complete len:104 (-) Transcript_6450:591-902(-)